MLGIDFGTNNSTITAYVDGEFFHVRNEAGGGTVFPSRMQWSGERWLFGSEVDESKEYLSSLKRLIGLSFDDQFCAAQHSVTWRNGEFFVLHGQKEYALFFLIREMLSYFIGVAREQVACGDRVVITTPAYFTDAQRSFLQAVLASLDMTCYAILNEPTAALLTLGIGGNCSETVLVYDFGAGTLDVSVVSIFEGIYQVMAVSCDPYLGGDDFTSLVQKELERLRELGVACDAGREEAEQLKIAICSGEESRVYSYEDFYNGARRELLPAAMAPVLEVLRDLEQKVDSLVLIGGTSRIGFVQEAVKSKVGARVTYVPPADSYDQLVSKGACIYGLMKEGITTAYSDIMLIDILPMNIGVEMFDGSMEVLLERGSPLPATHCRKFTTHPSATSSTISFYQGNRKFCRNNSHITSLQLPDLSKNPKITITMHIDLNNLLSIEVAYPSGGQQKVVKKSVSHSFRERKEEEEPRADEFDGKVLTCIRKFNQLVDNLFSVKARLSIDSAEVLDKEALLKDFETILHYLYVTIPQSAALSAHYDGNYLKMLVPKEEDATNELIVIIDKLSDYLHYFDVTYGAMFAARPSQSDVGTAEYSSYGTP